MVACNVCWELLVTREPFCRLLGMMERRATPFVLATLLSLEYTDGLFSHVFAVHRVLFAMTGHVQHPRMVLSVPFKYGRIF